VIQDKWLLKVPDGGRTTLSDVAEKLESALKEANYERWSYLSLPAKAPVISGFALVTRMEQIAADGTPSPEPARWSSAMPSVSSLSLFEFVKALIKAPPGYYRVIAFVVADTGWKRERDKPTGKEAERWLRTGGTRLPSGLGTLPYGPDCRTTVLVYEFKKVSQEAEATFLDPSRIRADEHLERAGISRALSR
jgi:hypothetical protein